MEVPEAEENLRKLKAEAEELMQAFTDQILKEIDFALFSSEQRVAIAKKVLESLEESEWDEAHEGMCRACGSLLPCYCEWDPWEGD